MNKHYHFIGIGGIGMSGIALILLRRGLKVSGSDLKDSGIISRLRAAGAEIFIGHSESNIKGADVVVYSSAIKPDNPEAAEAFRLNIPLMKRAQALAQLMAEKDVITVAGSHGKTTTSSLVSYLLSEAGFSPTAAIGGILKNTDANTYLGSGEFFVAEADESDGSFLYYKPKYSIITNIDYEHLDYYKDFDNQLRTFGKFIGNTARNGCVFCCDDDADAKTALSGYSGKRVLFGLTAAADIFPKDICPDGFSSQFSCFGKQRGFIGRFELNLPGIHNISNALAVIALALEIGIDLEIIKKALAGYKGASRRIEVKFRDENYLFIDDYAHHPTEIKATLSALRNLNPRRIIAVFQPHRYTRTKLLLEEFSRSFALADKIIITDIYAADEMPIEGVDAKMIAEKIKDISPGKEIVFLPKHKIHGYILEKIVCGDLVITLGAGDIVKVCDELAGYFKNK